MDILIVEDNKELADLLCDFLRAENYTVSAVQTKRESHRTGNRNEKPIFQEVSLGNRCSPRKHRIAKTTETGNAERKENATVIALSQY